MSSTTTLILNFISRLLGWSYFACWSLSFYPQILLNYKRRSAKGLAIDFASASCLGFISYTVFTGAFLFSPTVRSQYAYRHPLSPIPSVRFNDFAFALHGFVLSFVYYTQFFPVIWHFTVDSRQRSSPLALATFWACVSAVFLLVFHVLFVEGNGNDPSHFAWIDVVYSLSYVKLLMTVAKYCPQVWVNYKRKSTIGWSIWPIVLDITGGLMSILQQVIDSSLHHGWSGITGNPVKFWLGNVSIFFDCVFLAQHFIFYKNLNEESFTLLLDETV